MHVLSLLVRLHLDARCIAITGGTAASVWQPAESMHDFQSRCVISVYTAVKPPVELVAEVCSDSDRLKLVG